jgi:hypothetical protein
MGYPARRHASVAHHVFRAQRSARPRTSTARRRGRPARPSRWWVSGIAERGPARARSPWCRRSPAGDRAPRRRRAQPTPTAPSHGAGARVRADAPPPTAGTPVSHPTDRRPRTTPVRRPTGGHPCPRYAPRGPLARSGPGSAGSTGTPSWSSTPVRPTGRATTAPDLRRTGRCPHPGAPAGRRPGAGGTPDDRPAVGRVDTERVTGNLIARQRNLSGAVNVWNRVEELARTRTSTGTPSGGWAADPALPRGEHHART